MASGFIVGTCTQMCPDAEIDRREMEDRLHVLERMAKTSTRKKAKVDRNLVVKEFTRSAAGASMQSAEMLRTPKALLETVKYLLEIVITAEHVPWNIIYEYITDRLRAVKQDLVIQNLRLADSIRILQPIVKFYVYAAYRLCEESIYDFDPNVNRINLKDSLLKLVSLYDQFDKQMATYPNYNDSKGFLTTLKKSRPCMESIYLIFNINCDAAKNRILLMPKIWRTPLVEQCRALGCDFTNRFYAGYCCKIQKLPPLLAACAALHLPLMRRIAYAVMSVAYNSHNLTYLVEGLKSVLLYNSDEAVTGDCAYYNIRVLANNRILFTKSGFDTNKREELPKHCDFVNKLLSNYTISALLLDDNYEK